MIAPPSKEYLDRLGAYEPRITELAVAVRAIVVEEAPEAYELLYDATNAVAVAFTFSGNPTQAFIHIAAYAGWVNLGFNKGSDLPDPGCILRGEGRWIRHIRFSSIPDVERAHTRRFVRMAVQLAKRAASVAIAEAKAKKKAGAARLKRVTGGVRGNQATDSKPT